MDDEELLFLQYWTIECGRSMDEPHEKEEEAFLEGVRYARNFQSNKSKEELPDPQKPYKLG